MKFFKDDLLPLRMSKLALIIGSVACPLSSASEIEEVEFDSYFLNMKNPRKLDLSGFKYGPAIISGNYLSEVWFNEKFISSESILIKVKDKEIIRYGVPASLIALLPVDYQKLKKDLALLPADKNHAVMLDEWLPEGVIEFDNYQQRLKISLPQIYVKHVPRDQMDKKLWDKGVPAAILNYSSGFYRSQARGEHDAWVSGYAALRGGVNVNGWYLRHQGMLNWRKEQPAKYESQSIYLMRDLPAIDGRLTLGDMSSTGSLFDSVRFRGISITSDERMLPDSQRGYAPTIRGIARTNALVTVHQKGQKIYETSVSPGEFLINDLYPTGYGGNLKVTIREADGSEHHFEVPYASVAQLIRPGFARYSLKSGRLANTFGQNEAVFSEATWQQGITNSLTAYSGLQATRFYQALQGGVALGAAAGALALDVTHSRFDPTNGSATAQGQSYRASYSKTLAKTDSYISLATWRFSTRDFRTLSEAAAQYKKASRFDAYKSPRNRTTLTLGQRTGDVGQFFISGSIQDYWGGKGRERQYQTGFNGNYGSLSWGVIFARSFNQSNTAENSVSLNFSLPLGQKRWHANAPYLRTQLSRDDKGRMAEQLDISGNVGKKRQASYNLSVGRRQDDGVNTAFSGQYRTGWSALAGTYSRSANYNSLSGSVEGSAIAHQGGINFSSYNGENFALVEAKGAKGATVSEWPDISVGANGYAVVPNLMPYRMNQISLNAADMVESAELSVTSQRVAPLFGAVVNLRYKVKEGIALMTQLRVDDENNRPPFGAEVMDSEGNRVGYLGQGGQLYAFVAHARGQLTVRWGERNAEQCRVSYALPENSRQWLKPEHVLRCRMDSK